MTHPTDAQASAWMAQWRAAALALARRRAVDVEGASLPDTADALEDASLTALRRAPVRHSSGLVEQQRIFAKARHP